MRYRKRMSGMTLIEVVVGVGIMLTIFLALFGLVEASLELASLTKAEAIATELATNELERLRGLSYSSLQIGTTVATTTISGGSYVTTTTLVTFDDAADGEGAADADGNTADYLKAEVSTAYQTSRTQGSISLTSSIAPPSP